MSGNRLALAATSCGLALLLSSNVVQAAKEPIQECQDWVKACGGKKTFDSGKCKELSNEVPACDEGSDPGTICKLALSEIMPTQLSVGVHAARCKAEGKLRPLAEADKFKDGLTRYLLKSNHLVPTVIGPGADDSEDPRFFITDHHHLSYARYLLAESDSETLEEAHVFACIIGDERKRDTDSFWAYMIRHHFAWLDNHEGVAVEPSALDQLSGLEDLEDYPYRSWSRWVRDSCGYLKSGNDCLGKKPSKNDLKDANVEDPPPYFMEFKWADYLQQNRPGIEDIDNMEDAQILEHLVSAIQLARGDQAFLEDLPGYNDPARDVFPERLVEIVDGCEAM